MLWYNKTLFTRYGHRIYCIPVTCTCSLLYRKMYSVACLLQEVNIHLYLNSFSEGPYRNGNMGMGTVVYRYWMWIHSCSVMLVPYFTVCVCRLVY